MLCTSIGLLYVKDIRRWMKMLFIFFIIYLELFKLLLRDKRFFDKIFTKNTKKWL